MNIQIYNIMSIGRKTSCIVYEAIAIEHTGF